MLKKILATVATIALSVGLAALPALSAAADKPETPPGQSGDLLCTDITDSSYSPKVDANANDPFYVNIPAGYTLVAYCVKAGTDPQIVTLTTPVVGPATVRVDHPTKDSVSHYQLKLIPTVIDVCENLDGDQATVPSGYVQNGANCDEVQDVAVSGTPTHDVCEVESGDYTLGSILLTYTGPSSGVTVTYRKQGGDPAYLPVGSNPLLNLGAGTYEFKVEPVSSAYTTTTPTFTVTIDADENEACDEDQPENVAVSGTPTHDVCEVESGDYTLGSILLTYTGPSSGVTVTYRKQGGDPVYLPVGSNPLLNLGAGTYEFKVEPVSSAYTTTTPTFTVTIDADENEACDEDREVDTIGDPADTQFCEVTELDEPGTWVAYLTIASPSVPAGSVQYRVYFDDGTGTFPIDKGIWPEGTYHAGPSGVSPYQIPYGTTLKVVAEATPGYVLDPNDVNEWEYTFTEPELCDFPTLGTVTPVVTFAQTCETGATYTLAIEGGDPGTVQWSVNGGAPTTQLGTFAFPASSPLAITILATPTPPNGLDTVADGSDGTLDGAMLVSKEFDEITCDLTTLALTGQDSTTPLLSMAALLGLLGVAMVRGSGRVARREQV